MQVSENDSFFMRVLAYTNERFPVVPILITTILIGFNGMYTAKFIFQNVSFDPASLKVWAGLLSTFFIFFHLRLMDEFKDYEEDILAYPNRLLSRGVVTKKDLALLLFSLIGLELVLNIYIGTGALICWAFILIYSALMYKEFFIEEFLNKVMVLYLVSHQAIIPMIIGYFFFVVTDVDIKTLFGLKSLLGLACMSLTSFIFEIGRKTWNPEREQELADSYTKSWGIPRALSVLAISGIVLVILHFYFYGMNFLTNWRGIILELTFLLFILSLLKFYKGRTEKNSKVIEGTSSLLLLANHLMMLLYAIHMF